MIFFVALLLEFTCGLSLPSAAATNTDCGVTVAPQMTGGIQVHQTEYPWLAALYLQNESGKWSQMCGGTLISPRIVLTAAHCFWFSNGTFITPADIKVGLGKELSDFYRHEDNSLIANVSEIAIPQHYTGHSSNYAMDVGILRLAVRVQVTPHIMPACVDWDDFDAGKHDHVGHVVGWGKTENTTTSETALAAELSIVHQTTCVRTIRPAYRPFVTHEKFCAKSVNGGQVDKGDSGGGLTVVRNSQHYVIGVVSTKIVDQTNFSIFTNVTNEGINIWLKNQKSILDDSAEQILWEEFKKGYLILTLVTGEIYRVRLESTTSQERVPVKLEMPEVTSGPVFNCVDGLMYWGSRTGLKKSTVNATNITNIEIEEYQSMSYLTLDWVDQRFFWTSGALIKTTSIKTGKTDTLLNVGTGKLYSLVIHPKLRKMYFGIQPKDTSTGRLDSAHLDGSNRTVFHPYALVYHRVLAIDFENNELCWFELHYGSRFELVCKNLVFLTTRTISTDVPHALHTRLTITPFHYYWTDDRHSLYRLPKSSSTIEEVISEPLPVLLTSITVVSESCPRLTYGSMPFWPKS